MKQQDAYLVLDIGTGNVRSAIVAPSGNILGVARADIRYYRDELYPESIYFKPEELWAQLKQLTAEALLQAGDVKINAATTTSQREGIVLVNKSGKAMIGLPNIDHRGREWENSFADKSRIYQLTGRYPTSLFSAYKLVGIRERRKESWNELSFFLSISDWATWELSGVPVYEHSQASETLLYDVEKGEWSDELCKLFDLSSDLLPSLSQSGSVVGKIKSAIADAWNIDGSAVIVTGGGDTQMAIKSTCPSVGDVVIVSGTTTPVVKLEGNYVTDEDERTWTSRDIALNRFVFEANAGVTGLNYQRLKEVFYPNEGYDVIEKELNENAYRHCSASLGSLIAGEKKPVIRGGFIFPVPVSHELTRGSFVWSTLMDIAFSIAENYKVLAEVSGHDAGYIWACGGGLQSKTLRNMIAAITGNEVRVRSGFEQASVVGAAMLCNEATGLDIQQSESAIETSVASSEDGAQYRSYYKDWKQTREQFRSIS
ncbi:sugar kinase [Terrimonas sp. NA20]|uniref:Sugar kinase n=1 Tax=Terrimonas ginsenosidimutans TaxID=2908004 RepID=A0ABS9KRC4_9BACT|nr:FGGY family carbohydrate kinase [Terrimonas ginsenosidimutans]MCG2614849.1 sugar kinase [Terrimonas ginsenosidimutans]